MDNAQCEKNVFVYVALSMLYINDMLCNLIIDLKPYVATKDKETQKIYGALLKRATTYLKKANEGSEVDIYFFSEYCTYKDDLTDSKVGALQKEIKKVLEKHNVDDGDFLSRIEVIRCLADNAIVMNGSMSKSASKVLKTAKNIRQYRLTEISIIANNLANWVFRKSVFNLNEEESAYNALVDLCNTLLLYELHSLAVKYAKEEEERRLNGECLC